MSERLSCTVHGTEFCRLLEAVGVFQANPKDVPQYAAVRCFVRHDGLTMLALNLFAAAAGTISTIDQDGVGLFSLPFSQVRVVLAMFKRRLPKGVLPEEYVLEVEVTDTQIRIHETSGLFDNDQLLIAVTPPSDLDRAEDSADQLAMRAAAAASSTFTPARSTPLGAGRSVSPTQLALMTKAARIMSAPLFLRADENRLVGVITPGADIDGHDMVMATGLSTTEPNTTPPDTGTFTEYTRRLQDLADGGVL